MGGRVAARSQAATVAIEHQTSAEGGDDVSGSADVDRLDERLQPGHIFVTTEKQSVACFADGFADDLTLIGWRVHMQVVAAVLIDEPHQLVTHITTGQLRLGR